MDLETICRQTVDEISRFIRRPSSISLHNEGPAIDQDRLREIFNPFRQLAPANATGRDLRSLGLGLYIAHAIVTAHEGTIDVESNATGTTFTVRLPRGAPGVRGE